MEGGWVLGLRPGCECVCVCVDGWVDEGMGSLFAWLLGGMAGGWRVDILRGVDGWALEAGEWWDGYNTGVFCWLRGMGRVCLRKGPAGRVSMSISCSFGGMEMAGSSGGLYEYVSYAVSGFKVHAVLG